MLFHLLCTVHHVRTNDLQQYYVYSRHENYWPWVSKTYRKQTLFNHKRRIEEKNSIFNARPIKCFKMESLDDKKAA